MRKTISFKEFVDRLIGHSSTGDSTGVSHKRMWKTNHGVNLSPQDPRTGASGLCAQAAQNYLTRNSKYPYSAQDNPNGRSFAPLDGTYTWTNPGATPSNPCSAVRYTEGPQTRAWIMERDKNYQTRIAREAAAKAAAEQAKIAAEAERKRQAAIAAEAQRQAAIRAQQEAERQKQAAIAAEAERKRQAALAVAEAEAARQAEIRRVAAQQEAARLAAEQARIAAEAERQRQIAIAVEAERQRQAAILAQQAEAARQAAIQLAAQQEAARIAEIQRQAELQRQAAEQEVARLAAEQARIAAEAERQRQAAEQAAREQSDRAILDAVRVRPIAQRLFSRTNSNNTFTRSQSNPITSALNL